MWVLGNPGADGAFCAMPIPKPGWDCVWSCCDPGAVMNGFLELVGGCIFCGVDAECDWGVEFRDELSPGTGWGLGCSEIAGGGGEKLYRERMLFLSMRPVG